MVQMAQVEGQMRASALQELVNLVEANPEHAAAVLRRWLMPEDKT
jgi:flagellar M-ring protein FliF